MADFRWVVCFRRQPAPRVDAGGGDSEADMNKYVHPRETRSEAKSWLWAVLAVAALIVPWWVAAWALVALGVS